jgi:uncharacterized protein (DUF2236 family)
MRRSLPEPPTSAGRGPGGFTPSHVAWRLHREHLMLLLGSRALLMQAADPLALAGFIEHSNYDRDPWGRLWRTSAAVGAAIYGAPGEAAAVGRRVRAMHRRVRGRTPRRMGLFPPGTPYAADDPELMLWVHATLVDSALVTYATWVGPLTSTEEEHYHEEMKAVAELFGLPRPSIPERIADLRVYIRAMIDDGRMVVTPEARRLARATVLGPPLPPLVRESWAVVNLLTAGSLPAPIRKGYRLTWTPAHAALYELMTNATRRVLLPVVPGPLRRAAV